MTTFQERLSALVEGRRSQVVLGLDPDPADLWPQASRPGAGHPAAGGSEAAPAASGIGVGEPSEAPADSVEAVRALTAAAVLDHCRAVIAAVAGACVGVKLQLACFERLGPPGLEALLGAAATARRHDLLVIADGKRGDVPVTARAYSQALVGETPGPFGPVRGLSLDGFSAHPLLGRDSREPLVAAAREASAACFCLVRTSNPGAADIQELETSGGPLYERLARLVDELGASEPVGGSGLTSVGAVVGATRPDLLHRLRELMPRAIFLMPGVGAQGGGVESLAPAFAPSPAAGLVTASRSIVGAHHERGGEPAAAAAEAAEELRQGAWSLAP